MKRALTTGKGNLGFVEEKRREKRDQKRREEKSETRHWEEEAR